MHLTSSYFQQKDVVLLAQQFIGKILYTRIQGQSCAAIITETEAYAGVNDKASHAYQGKSTPRTKTMFKAGGIAYIYLIYGIHSLFNIVTNVKGIPHAILIRGAYPIMGLNQMKIRNSGKELDEYSLIGPGRLSKLMGIHYSQDRLSLEKTVDGDAIWVEDMGWSQIIAPYIQIGKRIGIDYAEEDALLPYRFHMPKSRYDILKTLK